MATTFPIRPTPQSAEAGAARVERVRREAEVIAQGRKDIDAGRGIDLEDLEKWLDRLDVDEHAPVPMSVDAARV